VTVYIYGEERERRGERERERERDVESGMRYFFFKQAPKPIKIVNI